MATIIGTTEKFNVVFNFYENGIFLTKDTDVKDLAPKDRICSVVDLDGKLMKHHFNSVVRLYNMYN